MWLTNSSVGRKMVMGITGLFLVLFVTFHVLMNAVALFSPEGYNAVCRFLGANWYAILGTLVLAAGFVIHIIYSFWLTLQNRRARGNDAYQVSKRPANVEWASQNMLVLGIIVVCFMILHLVQFALWFHMTHGFWSAFQSLGANNSIWLERLKATSNVWATVVCLLFAIEAIWFTFML